MKTPQKLTLIDGDFTLTEAREILITVFSEKLNFHKMKNFSSQERFGTDDKNAVKRIPQLKKSIEKIEKILKKYENETEQFIIKSEVIISLSKRKEKKSNEHKLTSRKSK